MKTNIQQCPVCKISRIDGAFYYSYKNTLTTPENVASTVCKYILEDVQKCGKCINPKKYQVSEQTLAGKLQELKSFENY